VTPPPAEPQFSASPTVAEITRARVFSEPLVPVGGEPTAGENLVLARALLTFHRSGGSEWRSTIGDFLLTHPESPWRAGLLLNVGRLQVREHAYSRALETFNRAWILSKDSTTPLGTAVADMAVSEWMALAARQGRVEEVNARVTEIQPRRIGGSAAVRIAEAQETLALIRHEQGKVVPCAAKALLALLSESNRADPATTAKLIGYRAPMGGTSLRDLQQLATQVGIDTQTVKGSAARQVPVPSIVHLKLDHYVTVLERVDARYRIVDGSDTYWIQRDTLLDEMSGYALIRTTTLPDGWHSVGGREAADVRGLTDECPPGGGSPGPPCTTPCCPTSQPSGGMAIYQFQPLTASLLLADTPVDYAPFRGPKPSLTLRYHQREAYQPQIFSSANLGPKWTFEWLRFVQEVPLDAFGGAPAHVWVYQPPGGREVYSNPDANGVYPLVWSSRAQLVRVSSNPIRYERRQPDGTTEVYDLSDGAPAGQRRMFMTQMTDSLGQSLQFTWDNQARLVAITDAIGQVTTLTYQDAADPLKITKITDPFGRFATMSYNASGQLASITDVIGMTSSFVYGPNDFVTTLTTPYGKTTFRHETLTNSSIQRLIEATDPLGGTEHMEFQWNTPLLPATAPSTEVPTGFAGWNTNLDHYNTLYWDKRAWMLGAGDITKATITHWLVAPEYQGGTSYSVLPHSVKQPLESRTWFAYPNQSSGNEDAVGSWREPSRVGRVLHDGTSQVVQTTYNNQGSVLSTTDPMGRQTSHTYAGNGIDLLEVRQTTSGMSDLLATYGGYNSQHLFQTTTDAAGQTTTMSYNAAGQVLTATNAKNETTTTTYDADGRLQTVTGPVAGATSTYTYDEYGRVRTVTDSDAYVITNDYDVFDRRIRVTYPDGTFEQTTYDRLDVSTRRDRAGRVTRYYYDSLGRVIAVRDPVGHVVRQEWCFCGSMEAVVDPNGNRTRWERDLEGRVTREVRADDVTATTYVYESASGRLATITDPKGQVTTYTYALDNAILSVEYTNSQVATPAITYTYDAQYGRVASMTDGMGSTHYTYHPVGVLGATQLASVDGPLPNDTITYSYDQLARETTRAINGAANTVTWTFDALGRVTSELSLLGTFTYAYDGLTGRLATMTYPNGQTTSYSYLDNAHDRRLESLHHKYPGGPTLSRFDYTYDVMGNVVTWRQQGDTTAVIWNYGYDAANHLTAAVKKTTDPVPTVLKSYMYRYDAAGNRMAEQVDDQLTGAIYDRLNRLVSQQPSGGLAVEGSVNEPALVTVQGKPTAVGDDGKFGTITPIVQGTNTLAIAATDPSGNTTSTQYEVDSTGAGRTFTYDANGNLTSDGTRSFEWDARNQLVAINVGTRRSEFAYDGEKRRVRLVEKENSVVQSDTKVIWCRTAICEERAVDGVTVTRQAFRDGEYAAGATRFFATDHLGSVTEVTDASGALTTRYAFDPWGRRTVTSGVATTSVGFTGHEANPATGLTLALYRAYDAELGSWIGEDPIGMEGGINLYQYVAANPLRFTDEFGLRISCSFSETTQYVSVTRCGAKAIGCTSPNPTVDHTSGNAVSANATSPCERDPKCNTWKFDAIVKVHFLVQYTTRNLQTPAQGGLTLGDHEQGHVSDIKAWCGSLNGRFKSEGFRTKGECEAAKNAFDNGWRRTFDNAVDRTHKRIDK
jgi:RHS repeat-associated protein